MYFFCGFYNYLYEKAGFCSEIFRGMNISEQNPVLFENKNRWACKKENKSEPYEIIDLILT